MIFHVEVIVDGDSLVFTRVGFGHLVDETFVPFGREVVTGEEIEHHLNLDDGIST